MQVKACGPRYAAMHIRRTDLFTALPVHKHTPAAAFEHFADAHTKANVFIAADNAESQHWMCEHCGGRARVHKPIQASGSLRQTGLQEAVIDLFVCAAATDGFMGSNGSSFSDAIRSLRVLQGLATMAEHRPPPTGPWTLSSTTAATAAVTSLHSQPAVAPPPTPPLAVMKAVKAAHGKGTNTGTGARLPFSGAKPDPDQKEMADLHTQMAAAEVARTGSVDVNELD